MRDRPTFALRPLSLAITTLFRGSAALLNLGRFAPTPEAQRCLFGAPSRSSLPAVGSHGSGETQTAVYWFAFGLRESTVRSGPRSGIGLCTNYPLNLLTLAKPSTPEASYFVACTALTRTKPGSLIVHQLSTENIALRRWWYVLIGSFPHARSGDCEKRLV